MVYVNFSFLLNNVRDQIELTSFIIDIKEYKEPSKDNIEIEIKSITEDDGSVIVSENNDGAVPING